MFQRRLKLLLILLLILSAALVLRAVQVQWIEHAYWRSQATELMKRWEFIETTRGAIRDRKGRLLAYDAPCIDACVDYRAITEEPDEPWVRKRAQENLRNRYGDQWRQIRRGGQATALLDQETARVKDDVAAMWTELARVSGKTPDEMDEIRRTIVARVEMRRRYLWWRSYERATTRGDHQASPAWYRDFLGDEAPDEADIDKFGLDVAEQTQGHVILHAVEAQTQAVLARQQDRFFALSLVPSKHRVYPFGRVACHILGHLGPVGAQEMGANDPFGDDELRRYWPNDLAGQSGVEALCEETLRGSRGRIESIASPEPTAAGAAAAADQPLWSVEAVPGADVQLSIDIELQSEIEQAFVKQRVSKSGEATETRFNQHGAAVVIDVPSGQVLALVSNPGFDPNTLEADYPALSRDDLNLPLLNRATQMAVEPGSTVKTIVGCGAITHGFMTPTSTVECTGFLVLRGHEYSVGRCWVATQYLATLGKAGVAHHPVPVPHPTGFLTISDALERSCNVVFETIADMMGMRELSFWFDQFGLGRKTGMGIDESAGLIPEPRDASIHSPLRMWTWFAGIGQGMVRATPLQMANVAATIARNGIWMRPQLVPPPDADPATTRPPAPAEPRSVDLHLAPEALAAVQEGMRRVCNSEAGSGLQIRPDWQDPPAENDPLAAIVIAGKTGSAQTALLTVPARDESGQIVRESGRVKRVVVEPGSPGTEGWYLMPGSGGHPAHAWFIGYAPASHPRVAFCVMVEYGSAGGRVAGAIAHDVLEACVAHGYLSTSR